MTDRLNEIYNAIPECGIFADVGCDHGYVAKAMLDGGKCREAIVSDVSAKCLKKAERLLAAYVNAGKARSVVSDGFANVGVCDAALIAGMGGEEIIKILSEADRLPDKLVLQPMKNADKVRRFVVRKGFRIKKDYVFKAEGKFYDLIELERGEDSLSDEEAEFGRTNLKSPSPAFSERLKRELDKSHRLVSEGKIVGQALKVLTDRMERIKKYV